MGEQSFKGGADMFRWKSQNAVARAVRVPPRRINEIVLGPRAVTADRDLRLARFFGVSEGFFLGLQMDCDLLGIVQHAAE